MFGATGRGIALQVVYVARLWNLFLASLYWIAIAPVRREGKSRIAPTFEQAVRAGVNSLPIAGLIIFLVGMILSLQLIYYLQALSPETWVPGILAVASTREIGPLLLAVVLAARVGAAITAEIGTMVVSEEVMALETMALNPVSYLVSPRLAGLVLMAPFLTIFIDVLGMMGGYGVCAVLLDMPFQTYAQYSLDVLKTEDVVTGLIKGTAFAAIVVLVGCHEGFSVEKGAEGVGRNTTRAVVNSIVLIILTDLVFTIFFYAKG